MFDTLLFRCAICEREVRDYPDRNGRDRHLEPLCRRCESFWAERTGKPRDGAMMDRRKAAHVLALSVAIHSEACHIRWSAEHGRA